MTRTGRCGAPRAAFIGSVLVAIVVLWWMRLRYWYPHDEGTLAQAALRVLHGEVPHRDFEHPYTGADAILHMVAFELLGTSLVALRNGFALIATTWLVGMALWFRHHLGEAGAAVVVLLLGAWSMAAYPAAVPSWYVIMFVTAAVAILVRRDDDTLAPARLVMAGIAFGLALSFKVTAVYGVVGVVTWLVSRDRAHDRAARPWVIALMAVAGLAVCLLLWPTASARTVTHLMVPPLAVVTWAIAEEVRRWRRAGVGPGLAAMHDPAWLGLGVVIGALPTFLWLALHGALGEFTASVAGVATLRAEFAGMPPPPLGSLLVAVAVVGLLATAWLPVPPRPWLVALPCALAFILAWFEFGWHRIVWQGLRGAIPLGIVFALVAAWRSPAKPLAWLAPVAALGWMTLSQFPFAAAIYFVYLVPLLLMTSITATALESRGRRVLATIGIALAAFGYLQVVPGPPSALGFARGVAPPLATLVAARGGLRVPAEDAENYQALLAVLADSVPPGPIWVGPDSPEVAFLAGRQDHNRAFFTFLTAPGDDDGTAGAVALVIRRMPPFSPPPTAAMLQAWQQRFATRTDLGPFTVLWGRRSCDDC